MRRDYYLHTRKGIFYVEFVCPETGAKLSARSTGERDRLKARVKAELWKIQGIPSGSESKPRKIEEAAGIEAVIRAIRKSELTQDDALRVVATLKGMGLVDVAAVGNSGKGAVPFAQFVETFWDYDKSGYIKDRLAHGYRLTKRHASECIKRFRHDIAPVFGDKKLNCVTTEDLKKLSVGLAERGLATSSINQIMLVCCTPLKWAFNEKIIPANPALGLTKFSITNKERGVLTEAEAAAVFAAEWKDKRAFVASVVAATTGARQGECLALRRSDIGEDTLNIAHSWSPVDGLKCPKNGKRRTVPLLPEVRAALLDLLADNPHGREDPFVFFSSKAGQPADPKVLLDGLHETLAKIGIDYRGRGVVFHSWRHFFCSKITQRIDGEKVAKVSGHLSPGVFKKYADHVETKNIQEVGNAVADAFGNVLPFRKAV